MIYLIRSIETDVDTKEVYDIVKIGYTKRVEGKMIKCYKILNKKIEYKD
jgi:hypothetical protein